MKIDYLLNARWKQRGYKADPNFQTRLSRDTAMQDLGWELTFAAEKLTDEQLLNSHIEVLPFSLDELKEVLLNSETEFRSNADVRKLLEKLGVDYAAERKIKFTLWRKKVGMTYLVPFMLDHMPSGEAYYQANERSLADEYYDYFVVEMPIDAQLMQFGGYSAENQGIIGWVSALGNSTYIITFPVGDGVDRIRLRQDAVTPYVMETQR